MDKLGDDKIIYSESDILDDLNDQFDPLFDLSYNLFLDVFSSQFQNALNIDERIKTPVTFRSKTFQTFIQKFNELHDNTLSARSNLVKELYILHHFAKAISRYNDDIIHDSYIKFRSHYYFPNVLYLLIRFLPEARRFFQKMLKAAYYIIKKNNSRLIYLFENAIYTDVGTIQTDVLYTFIGNAIKKINPCTIDNLESFFRSVFLNHFFYYFKYEQSIHSQVMDTMSYSETILDSYLIGKLSVEDLKQIGIDNLILKDMGEYSFPEGERIQHIKKIEELILSKALSYDNLESLREQGILSSDEFSKICDSRANQQAIEEIKALPEILNTGETLGESSIRTQESTTITKNQRYQISPEIIDEFLDKLGKNNVTRREISGGALDGYTLVLLENMRVVVLEKINTKRGENNATYVLPLIKAVELAEQSNKSELRTEENVEVVNHVRNYGTNLMRKIGMLQEKTISRDNRNVTWIKALPEGHQDEANKMIAQIQENYDENRGR